MSNLFNFCLKAVYPDPLKVAEVIPIFKKGGEQDKTTNTFQYRSFPKLTKSLKNYCIPEFTLI